MCNGFYSNRSGGYTGGCGCDYATPLSVANTGFQRICRDCNGNIRVINDVGASSCCGCQHCHCGCGCGCGGNGSGSGTSGNATNGNGGFGCVTICGATSNVGTTSGTTTTNVITNDEYYARQYGLGCRRSRCGCGGWFF